MPSKNNDSFNVDELLNNLFKPEPIVHSENLKELFDRRIGDLKITYTIATGLLKIQSRTLNGILTGTQKIVDFTNLKKIANFLQLPVEQVIKLYVDELEKNFPDESSVSPQKIEFIKENFDLSDLKRAGFIKSISDYAEIEAKIVLSLGLKNIFEYKKPHVDVAFSSGLIKPKNDLSRSLWIDFAIKTFKEFNNTNEYDREALIKYFPQIRWHSTNVELGFLNVIKALYKIGITVLYQSSLPSIHLRGATFAINDKPCIVITNYRGFYPTLWFALIHELFHVIFDWEEIRNNRYSYHLSEEETDELTIKEKEEEADKFAREYLFSKEKTSFIRPKIRFNQEVLEFAHNNHVHPSFIYVFNAYDTGKIDRMAWARARKENPDIHKLVDPLDNPWENRQLIQKYVKSIKNKYYN